MTFTTKTTVAASLIALMAGTASAQSVSADASVGADADASVGETVDTSAGADAGLSASADTNLDETVDGAVDAGTDAVAGVEAEVDGMMDDLESLSGTVVVTSDAAVIGTVETAEASTDGRVVYTVNLDSSLGIDAEQVSFVTGAAASADGELALDMTADEFRAAVESGLEASGGAAFDLD